MSDKKEPLPRVVVLTEQRSLAEMVKLALNHEEFVTRDSISVNVAMAIVHQWHPHVAIVDLDSGGDQFLHQIAPDHPGGATRIPALAVTRHTDLKTKLAAFDYGADDFMTVPLSPDELHARVQVITRRGLGQNVVLKPVVKLGELEIDTLNRQVRIGSSELHLTGMEQSLLYLLATKAGEVVTRDEILDTLWGVGYAPDSNVVDRHIHSLRVKLQNAWRDPRYIATVPGQGYRFLPVVSEHSRPS